jgi:hypothetical protein
VTPGQRAHATLLAEAHEQGLTGDEAEEYVHVLTSSSYGRLLVAGNIVDDIKAEVVAAVHRLLARVVRR